MSKFNVAIFKLPALYEILIEIKSELNFNLFNFTENNEDFKNFIIKNPHSLVISTEENKNFKNFIYYNKTFKIKILLQQINIFLSKSNYGIKSNISIGRYTIDTNSRLIIKDNLTLKLTEREIDLLIYLKNSKEEKTSLDLQKNVWKHSKDLETHTVETHIYRLRKKIFDGFGDNEFIINNKVGYKILK
mgnify:FL=1|tara:strand:- start:7 stop:573 length:567 start_codon:yes stop_codon:yes gene_type:complete